MKHPGVVGQLPPRWSAIGQEKVSDYVVFLLRKSLKLRGLEPATC